MILNLRSKRLWRLFNDVLEHLPNKKDKALISKKLMLVVDSADFIPFGKKPKWGAIISIKFKKSLAVLYLSPRRLPSQPDEFIKHIIASLLAHVVLGHLDKIDDKEKH